MVSDLSQQKRGCPRRSRQVVLGGGCGTRQLIPAKRHRHGRVLARAQRPARDTGGATHVAQSVGEDAAAAHLLRGGGDMAERRPCRHCLCECLAEARGALPVRSGLDRHADMDTLAAGQPGPTLQTDLRQPVPHLARRAPASSQGTLSPGSKSKTRRSGRSGAVRRAPQGWNSMVFTCTSDWTPWRLRTYTYVVFSIALLQTDRVDAGPQAVAVVLLEETRPPDLVRTVQQGQRPIDEFGQQPVRDRGDHQWEATARRFLARAHRIRDRDGR